MPVVPQFQDVPTSLSVKLMEMVMKKFLALFLAAAALAATASDAQAFGRRGSRNSGCQSCQPQTQCQPCQTTSTATSQPAVTYFPEYAGREGRDPATGKVVNATFTDQTTTAPTTVNGCANGTCSIPRGFNLFRRR